VAHLSHDGRITLAFLKNAFLEMLSLESDPQCKSPLPKALPHFLFPAASNNLSFQEENKEEEIYYTPLPQDLK